MVAAVRRKWWAGETWWAGARETRWSHPTRLPMGVETDLRQNMG